MSMVRWNLLLESGCVCYYFKTFQELRIERLGCATKSLAEEQLHLF
jgi:hypothetical protein